MNQINIEWSKYSVDEILKLKNSSDFGIYILFGNHRIYGEDVLLYIGKSVDRTFSVRIPEHRDWFDWIDINPSYLIGRLGGTEIISFKEWDEKIDYVESRLIHYCQPAWNSSGLNKRRSDFSFKEAIILNHGYTRNLPLIIGDELILNSDYYRSNWKIYNNQK